MAFPENDLERAIEAAMEDPTKLPDFYNAYLAAQIYIPQLGPAPDGPEQPIGEPPGGHVALPLMKAGDEIVVPIFSSMAEMAKGVPEGTSYLKVRGADLAKAWSDSQWAALNPFGKGKGMSPDEMRGWVGLDVQVIDEQGRMMMVGEPKTLPDGLIEALSEFCAQRPEITAAHRAWVYRPSPGEKEHLALAFSLVAGTVPGPIFQAADQVVRRFTDVPIEWRVVGSPSALADLMSLRVRPFYRRMADSNGQVGH